MSNEAIHVTSKDLPIGSRTQSKPFITLSNLGDSLTLIAFDAALVALDASVKAFDKGLPMPGINLTTLAATLFTADQTFKATLAILAPVVLNHLPTFFRPSRAL